MLLSGHACEQWSYYPLACPREMRLRGARLNLAPVPKSDHEQAKRVRKNKMRGFNRKDYRQSAGRYHSSEKYNKLCSFPEVIIHSYKRLLLSFQVLDLSQDKMKEEVTCAKV